MEGAADCEELDKRRVPLAVMDIDGQPVALFRDQWELDRIARLHDEFGSSVEEMETAAAAQVAGFAQVPFLGVRVLSNNITNGGAYDGQTAERCQTFVAAVMRGHIARLRR